MKMTDTNNTSFAIRAYRDQDFDAVSALWTECFPDDPPWNKAAVAIPQKLAFPHPLLSRGGLLVGVEQQLTHGNETGAFRSSTEQLAAEQLVGTIMAGYDGHRGWLYAVAVAPQRRRSGIGSSMVRAAIQRLREAGATKINLQLRSNNSTAAAFYEQLGFATEDRLSMGMRLENIG